MLRKEAGFAAYFAGNGLMHRRFQRRCRQLLSRLYCPSGAWIQCAWPLPRRVRAIRRISGISRWISLRDMVFAMNSSHPTRWQDANYVENPSNRCYFCKHELYTKLQKMAEGRGFRYVVDGNNLDDTGDYRPGRQAGRELEIRSPLIEARLNKAEIRELSRLTACRRGISRRRPVSRRAFLMAPQSRLKNCA